MNKIHLAFILISLVIFSTGILTVKFFNKNEDPRKGYEKYLAELNKKAPEPAKSDREKGQADMDQPGTAAFQEYLMTMDPSTGKVPRERLLKAYRSTLHMQVEKSMDGSLIWQEHGADMGGRTRMIMYDPNDATQKKVWAGGVTGGLWYNNNIQDSLSPWVPVGDFWPDLAIRCMAYDPNNPLIFYIGTGEAETALQTYRESSGLGDGIWRSTNGGVSWDLLSSTTNFAYVTKILVRNENGSSVIYAGVASGLYKGQNHQSLPTDGLYRSADQGATWQQVLPNISGSTVPYAVSDIAESADGRIFIGTRPNLDGEGGATLLYSDYGTTWNVNSSYETLIKNDPQYNIPGRVVLATAPSDANVVYALIASGYIYPVDNFKYYFCFYILRSADKGVTWTKMNLPSEYFANLAWHAMDIGVDPNSPNTVYVGGLDVYKSTNGGSHWSQVSYWAMMSGGGPQYIHADQHCIVYKPGSSDEILFGSDGGVFFTSNGSNAQPVFEQHNKNYNTLQFYSCAINPVSGANKFIGGLQDNSSVYYSGSPLTLNDIVGQGDGAYCFYDENDPTIFFVSMQYNIYYLYINAVYDQTITSARSGIFINPADYDYKLDKLFSNATDFIGNRKNQILRIDELSDSSVKTFVTLNTNTPVYFSTVRYSPYSPSGKSTIFLGTEAGRLYKVNEAQSGNPVVSEITGTNFPAANISSIAIAGSEDTLLVTFSNYGVPSVFQSFDGGITWQDKETNLPDMPIRWCLYHPENSKQAMLATETGVWSTKNLNEINTVWEPDVSGMPNVRTDMLVCRKPDNTVLAATHGRGCYTATWDVNHVGIKVHPEPVFSVYPNPAHDRVSVYLYQPAGSLIAIRIYDAKGIMLLEKTGAVSGKYSKTFDLSGYAKGIYYMDVQEGGMNLGVKKIMVY